MTIYLDYQATTPVAPEVRAAMMPWLEAQFGNPHSAHAMGRQAMAAVELARDQVAALLPANGQVHFTSGATEALNWAIKGLFPAGGTIAVSAIEHAAVLDTARHCVQSRGGRLIELPVTRHGIVDLDAAAPLLAARIDLVAIMHVNNEIGTIQPVAELATMAKAGGAQVIVDAVQGYGRLDAPMDADAIAVSAHKIFGPKGIGALWLRDGVVPEPLLHGGGQQQGLRSGTLAPALCAGMGVAASLMQQHSGAESAHCATLASALRSALGGAWLLNGDVVARWPGNLNIRREGIDVARLMSDCRRVAFSAGSACASGSGRSSHVLRAIGLSDGEAKSSIRLGFGRYTSVEEAEEAARIINIAADAQSGHR